MKFFLPMIPPTVTAQQQGINVVKGKPNFYPIPELRKAKLKFMGALAPHRPDQPFTGPVRLITRWCFPMNKDSIDGQYKDTRPDTDNSLKLFKDCLEKTGFFKDDAQVASELTEKFWAQKPGIYVEVIQL